MNRHLPDHLEDIVTGSHPSLGEEGWTALRNILHQYAHVFLAPSELVTGRTTSVQHEIVMADARPGAGPGVSLRPVSETNRHVLRK